MPRRLSNLLLTVRNGILTWREGPRAAAADVVVGVGKQTLHRINVPEVALADAVASGRVRLSGDAARFTRFMPSMAAFNSQFDIVTP